MLTKTIIDRVARTLQDTTHTRWSRAELLDYLNEGQRAIVIQRPDANPATVDFACASDSKQSLPLGGVRLLAVRRNKPGRAITKISLSNLDRSLPDWRETPADDGVDHYAFDPIEPKVFYLFPVPEAGHVVELTYSANPEPTVDDNVASPALDEIYTNSLMDYMLHRAYAKDATYGDGQRAVMYLQSFNQSLGIKTQVDSALAAREQPVAQQAPQQ